MVRARRRRRPTTTPTAALVRTADFWHEWLSRGEFPDHPWRTYLQRSALTLKGLTYAPTGAMIAAATTSLPETPGGERNWDYRYSWIRDSTFMLWGLYTLGFDWEANDFFYFIQDVASGDEDLQVMYGDRRRAAARRARARPPRGLRGRAAGADRQRRLRPAAARRLGRAAGLDLPAHEVARRAARGRLADPRAPGRDGDRRAGASPTAGSGRSAASRKHFVSSKVFCWVACDRGARLARLREDAERAERWQAVADEIQAEVCENGVDERGVFVPALRHRRARRLLPAAAAAALPAARRRARSVATVHAIADELTVDGLVLRYKVDETDDGLSGEEGTFAICSFWLVSAFAEIGETAKARALCEKLLGYASPLYLYAEEIDARSGRHLGNFPQAFTHLALINAVMHVIRADHELSQQQQLLDARRREDREGVRAAMNVIRCADAEEVASRAADAIATAVAAARATKRRGAPVL